MTASLVVTMLGIPGAGKTSYLVAMYGHLSLGVHHYSLVADDPNDDWELGRDYTRLCEDGLLPKPTSDVPQRYTFTFHHDGVPVAPVDLMDFRGGAMTGKLDPARPTADNAMLIERLKNSTSVYLVLDATHLTAAASPERTLALQHARRMSALARLAAQDRRRRGLDAPSLVVLITKADLLLGDVTGDHAWPLLSATSDRVLAMLPVLTDGGQPAMICPVSLGTLGRPVDGKVDPARVHVMWPEKPVLFSLAAHLRVQSRRHAAARDEAEAEYRRLAVELATTNRLRRGRIGELTAARDTADARCRQERDAAAAAFNWAAVIRPDLATTPIYVRGARVLGMPE